MPEGNHLTRARDQHAARASTSSQVDLATRHGRRHPRAGRINGCPSPWPDHFPVLGIRQPRDRRRLEVWPPGRYRLDLDTDPGRARTVDRDPDPARCRTTSPRPLIGATAALAIARFGRISYSARDRTARPRPRSRSGGEVGPQTERVDQHESSTRQARRPDRDGQEPVRHRTVDPAGRSPAAYGRLTRASVRAAMNTTIPLSRRRSS